MKKLLILGLAASSLCWGADLAHANKLKCADKAFVAKQLSEGTFSSPGSWKAPDRTYGIKVAGAADLSEELAKLNLKDVTADSIEKTEWYSATDSKDSVPDPKEEHCDVTVKGTDKTITIQLYPYKYQEPEKK